MTTSLENVLLSVPAREWRHRQTIALDWYDGAREGLCRLAHPEAEFYFTLLDERYDPEGLDERLMTVHQCPPGSGEALLEALAFLGEPDGPVWCPVWLHPDPARLEQGRQAMDRIVARAEPTGLVVLTRDTRAFLGCWRRGPDKPEGQSWFEALGIPPLSGE